MSDWIVPSPARLDQFLSLEGRLPSRVQAREAIEAGAVRVNEQPVVKPAFRLQEGDRVSVDAFERSVDDGRIEPTDLKFTILYEDDACLVIDKPAGIAVHPGAGMLPGEKTILHGVAHLFGKKKLTFSPQAVLVHRLDRETTGCLLIAKTPEAHRELQLQFESRTIEKTYLAIVAGVPSPAAAVIDAPVGRSATARTKMAVLGAVSAREARTTYRTLSTANNAALLACDLHTGRTHQLRVHLQAIGYPILGDPTYTSSLSERLSDQFDVRDLCLHAWKLKFVSPATKKAQEISAEVPATFARALEKLGLTL